MEPRPGDSDATAFPPIANYAFLSNCASAALVSRDGSVDWCCFHRFDGRPVFARLLDREKGGHFRVWAPAATKVERRYLEDTNVLATLHETPTGLLEVVDALPLESDEEHPWMPCESAHERLVRRIRCLEGSVEVALEYEPRFDYGITRPLSHRIAPELVTSTGGADALLLQCELGPLRRRGLADFVATEQLKKGDERLVALEWSEASRALRDPVPRALLADSIEETIRFWRAWSSRTIAHEPWASVVRRSALVLKGLTNGSTGAIAAAATTSLPECIGGSRNWDYRFAWIRDSVSTLVAAMRIGHREEAIAFGSWLHRTAAGQAMDLQIMYGLGGERLLHEVELSHLSGYRDSRPVRTGNGAWNQFQLDTYGELVAAFWLFRRRGLLADEHFTAPVSRFLTDVVETIARRWREPDEGAWEMRSGRRQFVSSKLMAWAGVESGIHIFESMHDTQRIARWTRLRDEIRAEIETYGIDPATGGFVQSYGSTAIDATALQVPLTGFLPPDDPRVVASVREVERRLVRNGHVFRYLNDDGLPGDEGAFTYCSLWLASSYARLGRIEDAERQLDHVLSHANDVGLLSEEIDPDTGELLGNYPQAFSHVGVLDAVHAIERAKRGFRAHGAPERTIGR